MILFNNGFDFSNNQGEYDTPSHQKLYAIDMINYINGHEFKVVASGKHPSTEGYCLIGKYKNEDWWCFIEHTSRKYGIGEVVFKGATIYGYNDHVHYAVGKWTGDEQMGELVSLGENCYIPVGFTQHKLNKVHYTPAKEIIKFDAKPLNLPSGKQISYDVFGCLNQYGAWVYVYAQKYEDDKITVNKFNTADVLDDTNIRYYPGEIDEKPWIFIKCMENTMFYKDKELTKAWYNEDGTTKTICKGQVLLVKSYGKIYR